MSAVVSFSPPGSISAFRGELFRDKPLVAVMNGAKEKTNV
jgi:hypothetical protein